MDKKEKFKKLAESRTNEVLRRLKILGNCSNRSVYHYDDVDVQRMFNAIDNKIREIKSKFRTSKSKEKTFKF